MRKAVAIFLWSATILCISACGGEQPASQPESTIAETKVTPSPAPVTIPEEVTGFESKQLIDMASYKDQLLAGEESVLHTLEANLVALVEHNKADYNSDFVSDNVKEAMKYYYGEQFHYRFTVIESIEPNHMNGNWHVTVLGQRWDTTNQIVEDVKMMYSIGRDEQGEWKIYTID